MNNLIKLKTENKRLKEELTQLQNYAKNLEEILEKKSTLQKRLNYWRD